MHNETKVTRISLVVQAKLNYSPTASPTVFTFPPKVYFPDSFYSCGRLLLKAFSFPLVILFVSMSAVECEIYLEPCLLKQYHDGVKTD